MCHFDSSPPSTTNNPRTRPAAYSSTGAGRPDCSAAARMEAASSRPVLSLISRCPHLRDLCLSGILSRPRRCRSPGTADSLPVHSRATSPPRNISRPQDTRASQHLHKGTPWGNVVAMSNRVATRPCYSIPTLIQNESCGASAMCPDSLGMSE